MGIQQDILKATQLIYDLKSKYPQQPVEELVQIVRSSYPNLNKALDRLSNQAKAGIQAAKKEAEIAAKKAAENMKELASNTAKTVSKGKNLVSKVSPFVKAGIIGMAIDEQLKGKTATTAQEQAAYNEWVKNKEIEKGIRYPNLQQELGEEYVTGASGKKYHVIGDRAYDFATGKPVVVNEMLNDITQRYQGAQKESNKDIKQAEMSNPKDFPFKTSVPVQNNVSNLPQAPRIQDIDPNPPIYDYNNGATIPPVQPVVNTNNNVSGVPTGASASTTPQQFVYQAYTPTGNYEMSPELLQQYMTATGVNQQNQISTPELKQIIQDRYQAMQESVAQDPRYQGNMIQSQGYYVDPNELKRMQMLDTFERNRGLGITDNTQNYLNNQRMNYEIQMANQAGVPYDEYKAAMLDRQKQQILARQKEITDLLTLQAQQTTDMKERLNLISEIYKVNQQAQQAIDVANASAFGDIQKQQLSNIGSANVADINRLAGIQKQQLSNIGSADVANINAQGDIAKQRELFQDPTYQLKGASQFYSSMGYLPAQFQAGAIKNLSPAQQQAMFGTQFTPEQLSQMYGTQNLPANNSAEQSNFNRFMAKIRGIQADEQ